MAKKKAENANRFPKATEKDFQVIVKPLITENIFASSRNVGYAKVVTTDNVSVVDLLNVDNLVISKASVKAIEEALK